MRQFTGAFFPLILTGDLSPYTFYKYRMSSGQPTGNFNSGQWQRKHNIATCCTKEKHCNVKAI